MTTALWISMTLHVVSFLFWIVVGAFTLYKLKNDYEKKGAELQAIYDNAREELEENIKNARSMAKAANDQFMKNVFRGGGDGINAG